MLPYHFCIKQNVCYVKQRNEEYYYVDINLSEFCTSDSPPLQQYRPLVAKWINYTLL